MTTYCVHGSEGRPSAECINCSLCNYGRDCRNNPVPKDDSEPSKLDQALAVYRAGGGFCGPATVQSVLSDIGEALIDALDSTQLGLTMLAVARAFHKGRATHQGVDVVDDAVWLPWGGGMRNGDPSRERGQLIPVAALRSIKISKVGDNTRYQMDYEER